MSILGLIGAGAGSMLGQWAQAGQQNKWNKDNAKEMAELNYLYGEKSADAAYQRQLGLLNANVQANSYGEKVRQAKEAGLSVGLLYGQGGAGGSASGGTAPQGTGASGMAAPQATQMANGLDVMNQIAQAKKVENESKLVDAQRKNIEADTAKKEAETNLTPMQRALMKEQAVAQWIENERKEYEQSGETSGPAVKSIRHEALGRTTSIASNSYFSQKLSTEIAEVMSRTESNKAMAELNTEKKIGYWTELLNATKNADSQAIQAAAIKLAAEWNTGEFTNWKTWKETAGDAVKAVGDLIRMKP